eukprot:5892695-Prymnesium_polylepis.1
MCMLVAASCAGRALRQSARAHSLTLLSHFQRGCGVLSLCSAESQRTCEDGARFDRAASVRICDCQFLFLAATRASSDARDVLHANKRQIPTLGLSSHPLFSSYLRTRIRVIFFDTSCAKEGRYPCVRV